MNTIAGYKQPLDKRRHKRRGWEADAKVWIGRWPRRRRLDGSVLNVGVAGLGIEMDSYVEKFAREPATVSWVIPPDLIQSRSPISVRMKGTLVHNGTMESPRLFGIHFDQTVTEAVQAHATRWKKLCAAAAATMLAAAIGFLKTRNVVSFWYGPLIQVYSLGAAIYVVSRVGLSMFYREPRDRGVFKSVTLIIAVKNEEDHIAETIGRCFQSHYPAHLMEVMVVDDGSTDHTWDILLDLRNQYPLLRLFRFASNRGKRHAMALGAEKARGEILIYMDSDSMVDPEGVYRIVQPFADPGVGAVAGHTLMIVERDNFISKMECVRYFVSQRVMKAAESLFGAVTCCPGPFSAYRKEAVLEVLQPWLHQTFLGTPATFGDDRSLTNFILRRYRVLYHAGARVSTFAPSTWRTFIRQQLRWKKSWVRETTIAVRHMWREHPVAVISYYFSIIITLVSPLIVLRAFIYSPLALQSHAYFPYIAGLLLVFLFLGLVHYYHTQSPYWYYGLFFAILYCCFFCLQNYYAILTVRQNHWGTR